VNRLLAMAPQGIAIPLGSKVEPSKAVVTPVILVISLFKYLP